MKMMEEITTYSGTGVKFIDEYAAAILTGNVPTDEISKRCVRYHLRRLAEPGVTVDEKKAERAAELIEKYFVYELFPWEKYLLGLIHAYVGSDVLFRQYDIVMGTGNGKNGFISGLIWYFSTPAHGITGYNVDIVANSEDQAKMSFTDIYNMLEDKRTKMERSFYWSRELIENKRTKSYIKYNTAGARTKAGKRSACMVFDEVYMYQTYDIINEMQASFGKRPHSRIFMITSQGPIREGVLDKELEKVEDVLNGENDALRLCPMIYRVSSEEEVLQPDCWEKANPSLPYLGTLRTAIETDFTEIKYSSQKEETFYTKRMNWPKMSRELAVATHDELMSASREIDVDLVERDCVFGMDLALLNDMFSCGLLFRVGDMRYWIQHSWICKQSADWNRIKAPLEEWQERGDLTIVDSVQIDPELPMTWLDEQSKKYNIRKIALDLARYALIREFLEKRGYDEKQDLSFVRPLGIASVSPVIESWFRTESIRWGDVPLMRWATNNTKKVRMRTENASGNYKYEKIEPRSRKTDPFMALVHAATQDALLDGEDCTEVSDFPVFTW